MKNILLSISLLVSNRIDTIRKCMESIKPILDAVPSELIAVDTGCTDGSVKIVEEYADKIIKFKWCDDFSAARNTGLKAACGEWFMFIDDDEWFEDATEIIEFFKSGEYKNYGRASYIVRNYADMQGTRYGDYYAGRLTKRTEEVAFTGRVHEHFSPAYEPLKHFSCFAHHYGYARDGKGASTRADRNIKLVLSEIEKNPMNFRMYAQLMQEYKADGQTGKALEVCEKVFDMYVHSDIKKPDDFAEWIIASWVRMYDEKDSVAALETAFRIEEAIDLGVVGCMLHCVACFVAAQRAKKYELVADYAEGYLEALNRVLLLKDIEGALIADSRDFVSDKLKNDVICGMMAACVLYGDKKRFLAYREQYGRHDEILVRDIFIQGIKVSFFWEELELSVFEKLFRQLVKNYDCGFVELKFKGIEDSIMSVRPEFVCFAKMVFAEERLLKEQEKYVPGKWQGRRVRELLYEYITAVIQYHAEVYSERQFSLDKRNNLPRVCRFALLIDEGRNAGISGDSIKEMRCMNEAAKVYSPMLPLMSKLVKNYMADVQCELDSLKKVRMPDARRMQKKQIEEFLKLLSQAHAELIRFLAEKKADEASDLLVQCQEGAVKTGTLIEKMEGEGFVTVGLLEEYCELVYNFYELIAQRQQIDIKKLYAELNGQLIKIKESVKKDIRVRREVVFLPYKASMWDSLESVWKAASGDEECDAYVVPIPYYDRNPDKSFNEFHYEGDLYPDYVPVVHYNDYDFEGRRPDVIFVHNPYDEINHVTSIEPTYYNKALHPYTDLLVYVEYGIPMKIFKTPTPYDVIIPGWFEFDVFCTYSEEYAKNQEFAMRRVRPDLSTDIVALGSPKFDKVSNSSKNDFVLLQEWKEIINGRKVVLLNTSLDAMFKDTEAYLVRLNDILEEFKKSKEAALWWRPHPLFASAVKSIRPDFAEQYMKLVDAYKQEQWGIYDETGDLYRAIAYTDAYYGDESSVAYLYLATGKPITIYGIPHQNYIFTENAEDFERALNWRMYCMQTAKGGNTDNYNVCMFWPVFYEDLDYKKFLRLFLDYVVHMERYPASEMYKELQLKVYRDFVVNPDGTAGQKIYEYCKRKIGGRSE